VIDNTTGTPGGAINNEGRLRIWLGFVNLAHRAAWPEHLPDLA
jgi:hypothetical protein